MPSSSPKSFQNSYFTLLRAILFPLLLLLQLSFSLASLLLRIYQALISVHQPHLQGVTRKDPPRHVALVFASSSSSISVPSTEPTELGGGLRTLSRTGVTRDGKRKREGERLVLSVMRGVKWAAESGIPEISVYNGEGLIEEYTSSLLSSLSIFASHSTPSPSESPDRQQLSESETLVDTGPRRRKGSKMYEVDDRGRMVAGKEELKNAELLDVDGGGVESEDGVRILRLWVDSDTNRPRPLTLHLLTRSSSSDLIARIAKRYAEEKKPLEEIDQETLGIDISDALGFRSDPSLLLIHHLTPPSFLRGILPRRAPELHGYPFWSLRITEIYQDPSPLPFLLLLTPLKRSTQRSELSIIRRFGRYIPAPSDETDEDEEFDGEDLGQTRIRKGRGQNDRELGERGRGGEGVLSWVEWCGSLRAWEGVEQRLGR